MSAGDGVKRVKSREFTGISPHQLAGTGVKLVKTRVVFVGMVILILIIAANERTRSVQNSTF